MDRTDCFDALLASLNEVCGYDYSPADIDVSLPITAYGVDSLNAMQILASVEGQLGVQIDQSRLSESDFASVDTLVDFIAGLVAQSAKT